MMEESKVSRLGTSGNLLLAVLLCVAVFMLFMAIRPAPAHAQCLYRMNDVGRPHGYLTGPCNGAASNLAGAYPSRNNATKQAPRPQAKRAR
jgi:hypothetical protein